MTKQSNTSRSSTRSTRSQPQRDAQKATIVLKTLHDDIMKANPSSTLTTKKMRVVLRAKMSAVHAKNSSWVFTSKEYDQARSLFDPAYAQRIAKATKRAAKVAKVTQAKVETPAE
jgi:hypothetical protein